MTTNNQDQGDGWKIRRRTYRRSDRYIYRIDSDQFVEPGADDGAPAAARLRTGAT